MNGKGVSEVVGYVLAFGIITLMALFIFYNVYPQAVEIFGESRIKILETQMSILDYSTSLSALGDSPSQIVNFNLNGGSVWVEDGGNHIEIYPVYSGSIYPVPIYNGSMGRVIAKYGDVIVAYEGGGVWEKRGEGVVMITPPEFHFKIDTLTLPIIKITGNFSAGGEGSIPLFIEKKSTSVIYPNATKDANFTNPLTCDYLVMKLQSDFYLGWKKYFEERSDAEVKYVDDANKTITVWMTTRTPPVFMVYEPPIEIRKLNYSDPDPIEEFEVYFYDLHSNYELVWFTETDPGLIIHLQKRSGGGNDEFILRVYYGNESKFEAWECEGRLKWNPDDTYLLDFLNSTINMTYGESVSGGKISSPPITGWPSSSLNDSTWTWGSDFYEWDSGDLSVGDNRPLNEVIQHYFRIMAMNFPQKFSFKEERGQGFNRELTTYRLYYDQMPPIITFLHIAEHQIEITPQ